MSAVFIAVAVLCGIALVAAVMLVVAAKLLAVPDDERVKKIESALPGANCGGCGYAGCSDYARAVSAGTADVNRCVPGGMDAAALLAEIMDVSAGAVTKQVAMVACHGSYEATSDKFDYRGIPNCEACAQLYAGRSECAFGCLGYGDCVSVCKFDALSVKNGLAHVDPDKCAGCGQCVKKCPKGLIRLVPLSEKSVVVCANHSRGNITHRSCARGCIACGKCVRACAQQAITIIDNLAQIDLDKCNGCGECVKTCPVHACIIIKEL